MIDFAALVSRRVSHRDDGDPAPAGLGEAPAAPAKPAAKAVSPTVPATDGGTEVAPTATSRSPAAPVRKAAGPNRLIPFLQQVAREGRDLIIDEHRAIVLRPAAPALAAVLERLLEPLQAACAAAGVHIGGIGRGAELAAVALLEQYEVEPILIASNKEAADAMAELIARPATTAVGLDTETCPLPQHRGLGQVIRLTRTGKIARVQPSPDYGSGLDPHRAEIRTVQVWWGGPRAYVFDMASAEAGRDGVRWSTLEPLWDRRLAIYNATFDCKFLLALGLEPAKVYDGMLAAGLVSRGEPNWSRPGSRRPSLAIAAKEILSVEVPKEGQLSDWSRSVLTPAQVGYAALDAVLTRVINLEAFRRMEFRQRRCWLRASATVPATAAIEFEGISMDRARHVQIAQMWGERLKALTAEVQKATGVENPRSGPQVAQWLVETLPPDVLATWPRTGKGALSTTGKHLRRVRDIHPGLNLLADWKQVAQRVSTFGSPLLEKLNPVTGRLHANLNIAQAKSGRFSSSNPNFQNMPRYSNDDPLRESFVAPKGRMLIVADYNQLELRCMAAEAKDDVMTAAYERGDDLHAITACALLGIAPDEFDKVTPEHADARQKAKAINFGIIYGSGPAGLAEFAQDAYGVRMDRDQAAAAINAFKSRFWQVAAWQDRQRQVCELTRRVWTKGGRSYSFDWEINGKYNSRLALNLPIQGAAAEIAQEALARAHTVFRDLPGRPKLVGQVHDEFLVEVDNKETSISSAKAALEQAMTRGFVALYPGAPTTNLVSMAHGQCWAKAK